MSLIKSTLRRIAIRNLDRAITRTYSNAINSDILDTIKDYVPNFPKFSTILISIIFSVFILVGGIAWGGLLFLLLKIFIPTFALLITTILITILYFLMFFGQISVNEIPSAIIQPIYVKDKRYKSGERFGKNINIPNNKLMIKFSTLQIIINVISAIILYIPSIIIFWILFTKINL